MDDDLGTTTLSNKAILGLFTAMLTAMVGIGGYNHHVATSGSKQGDAAEKRIENIEKQLARFIERGPKDVTANQRKIMVMGDTIIDKIKEFQVQEVQVRKQHDRLERNMQIMLNFKDAEMGSDDRFHRGMSTLHSEHKEILKEVRKN